MSERSAVVTGASSGIGRAISLRLADDGFHVLLADLRRDPITGGEPTEEVIRERGGSAEYVQADISDPDQCQRLVETTRQIAVDYGRDGILCNAVAPGKIITGTPGDLSADEAGLAYVQSRTPFARLGRAEDVAAAVAYLSSDASYTSGANLM